MDIGDTIAPKSDQQNYDDYLAGPRTVTVSNVKVVGGEQPVHIELAEYPGRPYKPNKSMRRVLAKVWGTDSSQYVGRRLTLFGNPDVKYGGKAVGGIEISHMSGISEPFTLPLTATRGRKKNFTVQPLADAPQSAPVVPDDVRANAEKAKADGQLPAYKEWLTGQGAPEHIMKYIEEMENK